MDLLSALPRKYYILRSPNCYQVLDKYLKSRAGRELSLDETHNIMNVVNVLRFTIDQMQQIDAIWTPE